MPELADVEGYRAALAGPLVGARVRDVRVLDAGVLRNATPDAFRKAIVGSVFQAPRRHGKWLALPTNGPTLLIHNGMTGRPYFTVRGEESAADAYDRMVIATNRGDLHYADLRKLQGVWIVQRPADAAAVIGEQGPDALEIPTSAFLEALRGHRGGLKSVLMNQQVVSGLGNMLSDEICWRAHLHPALPVAALDDDELRRLHRVMRSTLRRSVARGQIPRTRSWLTSTRDRESARCPRCGSPLQRSRIAGRTSIWCASCQPEPVRRRKGA